MKKFLFIIPPYFSASDYEGNHQVVLPTFTIPYGILSLVSFLNSRLSKEVEFDIVDLNITLKNCVESNDERYEIKWREEVLEKLGGSEYYAIGISALFNSAFSYLNEIAEYIKSVQPNSYIITGGGLPSAAFGYVLKYSPHIDAVCKGEGELPLLRVLDAKNISDACDADESFATRTSLKGGQLPKATYIDNLDEIPPLEYFRVELDNYNSRSIDKRYSGAQRKREMAIHTSRGCPFKCVFCSNPSIHGYTVRFMSLEKVEEEVRRMKEEFGMTVLLVEDDHFFHNINRAKDVLRIFARHNVRAEFPNGMAVYAIDNEVGQLLADAGVSAAALAVESGSDYVLAKLMKKPVKTKFIKPAVKALRDNNVRAHVFIVAGIPGETDEHREETRMMLLNNDFDWIHIYCAIPIFGSKLFEICMENNYIDLKDDPANFVTTKSIITTPDIDPTSLQNWVYRTQVEANFVSNSNIKLGDFEAALPYFENVVEKYPKHAFGRLLRGISFKGLGRLSEAEKDFEIARELFLEDDWRELAFDIGAPALDMLSEYNISRFDEVVLS